MSYAIKFIANTILLINLQNVAENLNKKKCLSILHNYIRNLSKNLEDFQIICFTS